MELIANVFGTVAAIFTTGCFIPQLVKIIKTKQTGDLSLEMYLMFTAGITCWEIYGILIKAPPVIISNFLSILMNGTIIFYKLKYK